MPLFSGGSREPIRITADTLVSDPRTGEAEFIDNVRAERGTAVLTADRILLRFHKSLDKETRFPSGKDSIERVVASGRVRIRIEDLVADTDRAEYDTGSRKLVLSGKGTRVQSGGHEIAGGRITLFREGERIRVSGGAGDRVRVRVSPGAGKETE